MLTRKRLTALIGLGLIGCIILGSACDVLNPEFVGQMGGNPIPGSTNVRGYVLVVLNNLTTEEVSLTWEADVKRVGQAELALESMTMMMPFAGYYAVSLPCGVTEIRLVSLMGGTGLTIPDPDNPDDSDQATDSDGTIDLPTTVFTSPVLQCGSVVVVTVVGTGVSATADVQILN